MTYSNETCKFCGQPLLIHGVQESLTGKRSPIVYLHCIDPECPLKLATGVSADAIWNTWQGDLRNRGLIK
jgi:hypothetical protein